MREDLNKLKFNVHATGKCFIESEDEPPFEVNTSARVVTGVTPGPVAWKCSWWCLILLRVGGKGALYDQDVTKISFPPMNAQGLVVVGSSLRMRKFVRRIFLTSWLLG